MNRTAGKSPQAKPFAESAVLAGSRSARWLFALALAAASAVVLSVALQRPAPALSLC